MGNAPQAPATAEGPTQHTQNQAPDRPANTYGYSREEQIAALHKLREPFPPSEVRHMPRIWCRNCKNSHGQGCQQHRVPTKKCGKCGQKMPEGGHIDLAYVGHAEATNRLLNVDPFWDWEPLTVDERGLPQVDGYQGMWIRLTVCGMTRLGYGHADGKTGGDAVKEVIGDAIRNAGMRFGMALDLWTSSDLKKLEVGDRTTDADDGQNNQPSGQQPAARPEQAAGKPATTSPSAQQQSPDPAEALVNKVRRSWNSLDAMRQNLLEAGKLNILELKIPFGKEQTPRKLGDLINGRIAELEGAGQERNAA